MMWRHCGLLFQSAPRSCDRSDRGHLRHSKQSIMFQSAPRSCDRSDREAHRGELGHDDVSIRAPVLRPERLGEDRLRQQPRVVSIRAPVLRPERQLLGASYVGRNQVSIRAPVLRPERPSGVASHQVDVVSIRAPVLRPERPRLRDGPGRGTSGFNPRPGPATGATLTLIGVQHQGVVSIRAPVLRPERPGSAPWRTGARRCFNPRPGPATGATG